MHPAWLEEGKRHVWRPYCQHQTAPDPLPVVGADGSRLLLADGRSLVDGTASWWTAAWGYRHPHIEQRVREQLEKLPHVAFGGLAHEAGYTLATRLAGLFPDPLNRVFFVESGSVAVEVALKMALQGAWNRGETQRVDVVAFSGAYHGDSFATMALCDPIEGMHQAFAGKAPFRVHHVDVDDLSALGPHVAACVIEPRLQAASGMRMHDAGVLERLRAACTQHGVTLIFDEIATGFHRTGPRFAGAGAGVVADVVVVGKALSGGTLPLAAAVASDAVFSDFLGDDSSRALQHGPTYMANALACAAAHGSLDLFASVDVGARVAALEGRLLRGLAPLRGRQGVRDVRVLGGVAVVEVDAGAAPASSSFAARGAFVRPLRLRSADLIYLMPPLNISDSDVDVLLSAVVD